MIARDGDETLEGDLGLYICGEVCAQLLRGFIVWLP